METADGSTCDGDTEEGEDGQSLRVVADEGSVGEFRNPTLLRKDAENYTDGHDEQGSAEERIKASDERVDGQQCRQYAVKEHEAYP